MALALTLVSVEVSGNRIKKTYSVVASGSYANSGTTGDLFDFQGASNPNHLPRLKWARNPDGFSVENGPAEWVCRIQPGTDFDTWGLRFFEGGGAGAPLDEMSNGAYASEVTASDGDPLRITLSGPNI